jgi:hypothetical protein
MRRGLSRATLHLGQDGAKTFAVPAVDRKTKSRVVTRRSGQDTAIGGPSNQIHRRDQEDAVHP